MSGSISTLEPQKPPKLSKNMEVETPKMLLSLDIMQSLRCSICDNFLTVPPITITSIYGNEWKCGRCAFVTTDLNIPAVIFETVAVSMKFPCIHPNCDEEIAWEGIKAHEDACPYQPMKCPCGETVEMHSSHMHFRQSHPDIISNESAVLENPGFCQFHTRLILKNDVPFLVYVLCERKADIKVGVYCLQETVDVYEFKLKLSTNSSTSSISLPDQKITKFSTRENCSDCLLKTCKIKCHKYYESNKEVYNTDVYETMSVRINTLSTLNVLNSDDIILKVTIIEKGSIVNHEATLSKNEQIRKSWECQICQEYLVMPIFICPTGHSVCGSCKSKLTNCPYCILTIGESRNFALEEMAENVEISCQYESKGCNFFGNVERIAKHEPKCAWKKWGETPKKKAKICPYDCGSKRNV